MNRKWRLKRPIQNNELVSTEHFELSETIIPNGKPQQFLVRTLYLGTSPAQRAYVTQGDSMHNKVEAGEVMRGRVLGLIVESESSCFAVGDLVIANTGWQDYNLQSDSDVRMFGTSKLENPVTPYSTSLGILGAAGLTAYFGLIDIGAVKSRDTVLVLVRPR